ncbi:MULTISPECIES: heavy-metal-associated domain-containing protein [Kordiimonas]|mgnify:CR=1 FL=1|jgi:mercuric ion binding protein|uniref:heavy-metal-associated domain-containing protein n=1 Tax=Kordiimonas TaxID=288021 RepID=UPI0025800DD6|nr:cation transporter [Kordiimonas sp. UBA4487]
MKHILKATIVGLALGLAIPAGANAHDTQKAADHATQKTVTFTIEKMTCAMCPITVRKAMEKVAGVLFVETDYDSKTATVVFDPSRVNTDAIAAASTNAGYPAKVTQGS